VVVKAGRQLRYFLMIDISPALTRSDNGTILVLEVTAGSKASRFPSGYNEWRRAVSCTVRAPADEGKANRELINLLAAFFSIPKSRISIMTGATSSIKRVCIEGLEPAEVEKALAPVLSH
jgi:uncharacterized protein (TIGR00251 family)